MGIGFHELDYRNDKACKRLLRFKRDQSTLTKSDQKKYDNLIGWGIDYDGYELIVCGVLRSRGYLLKVKATSNPAVDYEITSAVDQGIKYYHSKSETAKEIISKRQVVVGWTSLVLIVVTVIMGAIGLWVQIESLNIGRRPELQDLQKSKSLPQIADSTRTQESTAIDSLPIQKLDSTSTITTEGK